VRVYLAMLAVLAAALIPAVPSAQTDASLRAEWSPDPIPRGGWMLEGYVYNSSDYRMSGVRLAVDVLNASGEPEARALGWVQGDVPARGRSYFSVPLPKKGASYRVTVLSADPVSRDAP